GQGNRQRRAPDLEQSQRLDARAGQPAHNARKSKSAAAQADGNAGKRLGDGYRVGTDGGSGLRGGADVSADGRQLGQERQVRDRAHGGDRLSNALQEGRFDRVRSGGAVGNQERKWGEVQLQRGNAARCGKALRHLRPLRRGLGGDADDERTGQGAQAGQVGADKGLQARIGQAGGVQQPGAGFGGTRHRVAASRL